MIAVTIENSTYCGYACLTCARQKMKNANKNMPDEFFFRIVDDIKRWNEKRGAIEALSFVGMGDPLMDSGFINKARYVKEHTSLKIHLTNTAHMLKGDLIDGVCEYVDSVKISHYGVTNETYRKVHGGGQLQKVVENIEKLLDHEKRPRVTMTFLMVNENKNEMDKWIQKWQDKCDSIDVWMPHNWGGNYESGMQIGERKSCNRPGRDFEIHVDGKVSVCCLDVCEDLIIGDLNEQSWQEILESPSLKKIIGLHEKGEYEKCGICANCDLLYDRKDALIYSSDETTKVGRKAGYSSNAVDFFD